MAYTYADFENAVKKAGMTNGFSQYDLDLARQHPEAGLSLLSLKQDYQRATTDEQRALANTAANQIRGTYGSYTGGSDGMQYYATGKPAASFPTYTASSIPEYTKSKYGQKADSVLDKIGSFGQFSYGAAPTYNNAYQQLQKQMLDEILNRPEFSWSKETDPNWSSYKKSYLREGDRATANALGQASAASGGRASSYAVNAATQAGDYYATKLNDVIPTLYQQAYDRYLNDYQMKLSDLGAVNNQEQLDYNRYLTDLSQYNADRSQAYNEYLNDYNMLQTYLGNLNRQEDTEYTRYLDSVARDFSERQYADQLAQQAAQWDFSQRQYADQLAQRDQEWQFKQRQYTDQMTQQELENRLTLAQLGGSYGDYGGLNGLGINPNLANIYQAALAAAGRVTPVGSGSSTARRKAADTPDIPTAKTAIDYRPDEGVITWDGHTYNSLNMLETDLKAALSRGEITPQAEKEIRRKLAMYGISS